MDSEIRELCRKTALELRTSFIMIELENQTAYEYTADGAIIERDKREVLSVVRALEADGVLGGEKQNESNSINS